MTQNTTSKNGFDGDRLLRAVSVATSVAIMILGVLFIIFCAHLYFTGGDHPYSRERVGSYLLPLVIPSVITVALAVTSFVLTKRSKAVKDENAKLSESYRLYSFSPRFEKVEIGAKAEETVTAQRRRRLALNIVFFSVSSLFSVSCISIS